MQLIIVHRLLQSILLPPLNAVCVMFLGYLIISKWKKIGKTIILCGGILFYIQTTPFFAYYLTKTIELPPLAADALKDCQAIVVIGGGLKHSYEYPTPTMANTSTLIRLEYTAFLAKQDPAKLVIVSGGYNGRRYTEASIMRDTLVNTFAVKNPIIIEDKSRNTTENAKYVAKILLPRQIHNIILVSQAYHERRAVMLFKKFGLNPVTASTDYIDSDDAKTITLMVIPNATAMALTARTLHEIFGYYLIPLFSVK